VEITEILRHGVITEKTVKLQEQNKYTFKVALEANKIDVRRAVETMFNEGCLGQHHSYARQGKDVPA